MSYEITPEQLEPSWHQYLSPEFKKPYWALLQTYLTKQSLSKKIYPPAANIFTAFSLTPYDKVKVVIVGQDPYHGGQAHGLAFSVQAGHKVPPSLRNIYKAIEQQVGHCEHTTGDLTAWAKQGVLLLNAVLTVERSNAGAHQKKGWETFTDKVIEVLNAREDPIVFLLWGNYAKKKGDQINRERHCVLESAHPSPLSARHGFFENEHFNTINTFLTEKSLPTIQF